MAIDPTLEYNKDLHPLEEWNLWYSKNEAEILKITDYSCSYKEVGTMRYYKSCEYKDIFGKHTIWSPFLTGSEWEEQPLDKNKPPNTYQPPIIYELPSTYQPTSPYIHQPQDTYTYQPTKIHKYQLPNTNQPIVLPQVGYLVDEIDEYCLTLLVLLLLVLLLVLFIWLLFLLLS